MLISLAVECPFIYSVSKLVDHCFIHDSGSTQHHAYLLSIWLQIFRKVNSQVFPLKAFPGNQQPSHWRLASWKSSRHLITHFIPRLSKITSSQNFFDFFPYETRIKSHSRLRIFPNMCYLGSLKMRSLEKMILKFILASEVFGFKLCGSSQT